MNKVFLAGRLTADPTQFVTQTGKFVCNINIASPDNINKNEVYFFPCVAWQSNAKFITTYLKKGDSVIVDGKLVRRSYVSKEGKNVFITEIIIDTIKPFGNSRRNSEDSNNQYNNYQNSNYNNSNQNQNYNNQNQYYNNQKINNTEPTYNNMSNNNDFNENSNMEFENKINYKNNSENIIYDNNISVDDVIDLDWLDEIDK